MCGCYLALGEPRQHQCVASGEGAVNSTQTLLCMVMAHQLPCMVWYGVPVAVPVGWEGMGLAANGDVSAAWGGYG